jgi:hypothetical protein
MYINVHTRKLHTKNFTYQYVLYLYLITRVGV